MTTTKRNIVWTSEIDLDDYKDYLEEEYPEVTDEMTKYQICNEERQFDFECEQMNLDIELGAEIIAIGDLGLWNGRRQAYRDKIGTNVADCLSFDFISGDYVTWYVDELGDLICEDIHHDGTNYYTFRVFKPNVTEGQKENFKNTLWVGGADRKDINRYTSRIGDRVARVYGWKVRGVN